MAAVAIVGAKPITGAGDAAVLTWTLTTADHTGDAIAYEDYADRTVQFTGTFGGATVVWEGSLDNTNFFTLTDPQTSPISKTAAALEAVTEAVNFARPRLSVVGAGATIVAICYARKTR